jgi:hypothetical protein
MPKQTVEIQQASEIDYSAYAAFQRDAYRDLLDRTKASDAHMTPEFYRWKYRTPDGMARIASVTQEGETLSSSAMLPLRVRYGGETAIGWHCVDVATLPKARRRGLFLATLRTLTETIPSGDLLFAFPNSGSIVSFLKLGCVENGVLTTWISPTARLVKKRNDSIVTIDEFGTEHGLPGDRTEIGKPMLDRHSAYLNWRYTNHPNNRYVSFAYMDDGCEGYCVVRDARVMGRKLALVMEVFGSSPRVETALLRHAADWASSAGTGTMVLMNSSLPLSTAVRVLFVPVPSVLLPKRQVLVLLGTGGLPASLMGRRWALQTGDWDVF